MMGGREASMLSDEGERIQALLDYRLLDTAPEEALDNITRLTARLFHTPIALISLIDTERQWFKSRVGLDATETPREYAFCDHAIRQMGPFIVGDALRDRRFADNPLVTADPKIRFYCGIPLRTPEGHGLGTLCVIDREPRVLSELELATLKLLARQVELELETRRRLSHLQEALTESEQQSRSRELMIAMLVHDLRSPLTSLTMLTTLLEPASAEAIRTAEDMLAEIGRMRRMLNDVLDICLYEVGKLRARCASLEVEPFFVELVRRLARLGSARQQQLELELPSLPVKLHADGELLERVVENLVLNAMDHGPAEQPIQLAVAVAGDAGLRVEVIDRGQPLSDEARSSVFQVYPGVGREQAKTQGRGYGLGLAFCRLAVEAHGGRIEVVNGATGGNCFRFFIPFSGPSERG
jgi:K+-sensing histidine kinase KdpD